MKLYKIVVLLLIASFFMACPSKDEIQINEPINVPDDQRNQLNKIEQEWKLNTKSKTEKQAIATHPLLTNPPYKFPIAIPDGSYE